MANATENLFAGALKVAAGMMELFRKAADASNAARLRIAQGNVEAGLGQLQQQETVQRRTIARSLEDHVGSVRASEAFRGGGPDLGAVFSASARSAEEAAVVTGNRAANEAALIAQNQVQLEDPVLAAVQGFGSGLDLGSALASSLFGMTEVNTSQSSREFDGGQTSTVGPRGSLFENKIKTVAETPGLDLSKVFRLDKGGDLSLNLKGLGF